MHTDELPMFPGLDSRKFLKFVSFLSSVSIRGFMLSLEFYLLQKFQTHRDLLFGYG